MSQVTKLTLMLLGVFGLLLITPHAALANDHMVVITKDNHFVIDSNGKCVRTKFMNTHDVCGIKKEILVMDERIIYFGFDSAMLDDEEKMKLNRLAQKLIDHKVKDVTIVGYTDRIGSHEYNQKLSEKRANSVKKHLDSKVNLDSSPVEVRGMGEKDEVKLCKGVYGDEAIKCLAPNRRVEVEIDYYDMIR